MIQLVVQFLVSVWMDLVHAWQDIPWPLQAVIIVMTPLLIWGWLDIRRIERRRNMPRRRTPPR